MTLEVEPAQDKSEQKEVKIDVVNNNNEKNENKNKNKKMIVTKTIEVITIVTTRGTIGFVKRHK